MKLEPISKILANIDGLPIAMQVHYVRCQIASEQGGKVRKTSVRIRELQRALQDIQTRRLKVEQAA